MQLKGKRSYGKIASLPPEVRNAVDNMLLAGTMRYDEILQYIAGQGVDASKSSLCRYAKRLADTYRDLTLAQDNNDMIRKDLEKYPEQDATEALTRIVGHKLLTALVSKTDEEWSELRADKLLQEISGVTRAVAYKKRVEMQNQDIVTAALDEVQASVFSALADEQPELYQKLARFIERKKAEGL